MDHRITQSDYRSIAQSLAIVRLQTWLLQRQIEDEILDDATLFERLREIDVQTVKINQLLDAIQGVSTADRRSESGSKSPGCC
jgi:hypothetical protein